MAKATCSVDGCEGGGGARGLCPKHDYRVRRFGSTGLPEKVVKVCAAEGCSEPARTRGFCGPHYKRWSRTGDPLPRPRAKPEPIPCSVAGCDRDATTKAMCPTHYERMWRTGRTDVARFVVEERFEKGVNRNGPIPDYRPDLGPCWIWGKPGSDGYKRIGLGTDPVTGLPRYASVHRWTYERYVEPIPEGFDVDHLCRVHACCNPSHLEAVTHRENVLRGVGVSAQHARKTHCIHGHEFSPENTTSDSTGKRICKTCRRERAR